jgi:hypothetical protein
MIHKTETRAVSPGNVATLSVRFAPIHPIEERRTTMRNTSHLGNIATAAVLAALLRKGYAVLTPFGDAERYDLVIDMGVAFEPVQCKHVRLRKGVLRIPCHSVDSRHASGHCVRRAYDCRIVYYGVYCPDNGRCYLVPATEMRGRHTLSLRVEPSRGRGGPRTHGAAEFELK